MSQHTLTHDAPATTGHPATTRDTWITPGRAARELGLKRSEFDLAVNLGRIRTVTGAGGEGRRVDREEIERLRARPGSPETLRASVETVGTTQGAALMEVTKDRFTRLARLGLLVPVRFYVNRYRSVVWLYLAEELRQFAADERNAQLLTGRTPGNLRSQLDAGTDLRPRNWRSRHLGFLRCQADDPWARAGAVAALLAPLHVAEVVNDPYDRSRLNRFRPPPPSHHEPGSPAAQLMEELTTAQDDDEIARLQADLARLAAEAREHRAAPRPAPRGPGPRRRPHARAPREPRRPHIPHAEPGRPDSAHPEPRRPRTSHRGRLGRWLRGHR